MKGPSPKQKEILSFIDGLDGRRGRTPTLEEIAERLHVTPQTVFAHVKAMKKKGLVTRTGKSRSIEITGKAKASKQHAGEFFTVKVYHSMARSCRGKTLFAVALEGSGGAALVEKKDGTAIKQGETFECGTGAFTAEYSACGLHLHGSEKSSAVNPFSGSVIGFFTFAGDGKFHS